VAIREVLAMTTATTPLPDVQLPAGATYVGDWEKVDGSAMPYRFIGTTVTQIAEHVSVWTSATQFADGSVDDGRIEAPSVYINDGRIPNEKVRGLIAVLQESLALVEAWGTGSP
jgi:hypothetical protein